MNLAIGCLLSTGRRGYADASPACWLILTTTNSAGFSGREAHQDVDHPGVDVGLGGRLGIAFDEERPVGRRALERALTKQRHHERADGQSQLRPKRFVVRFEHRPLDAVVDAGAQHDRGPAHRDVSPLGIGGQRAGSEHHHTRTRETPDDIDAYLIQVALLDVAELDPQPDHAVETGLNAGGRLPHPARGVDACVEPGHIARWR